MTDTGTSVAIAQRNVATSPPAFLDLKKRLPTYVIPDQFIWYALQNHFVCKPELLINWVSLLYADLTAGLRSESTVPG